MSDEAQQLPDFAVDAVDECAPTEREPSPSSAPPPRPSAVVRRGTALSVLWWSEGDAQPETPSSQDDDRAANDR
jgi:hypothetical protein